MKRDSSRDPLVAFLYVLMRDRLTSGAVENIMEKFVEPAQDKGYRFTNGYLAAYAKNLARRLRIPDSGK